MDKEGHLERTASEPRDRSLHNVVISAIIQVNSEVRIIRLQIPESQTIKFLPGQWLDVYVPSVPKPGGFSITSPPSRAVTRAGSCGDPFAAPPYLELAVRRSPENPPAAFLWRDFNSSPASSSPSSSSSSSSPSLPALIGTTLQVRVGGSFVWPPRFLAAHAISPDPSPTPSTRLGLCPSPARATAAHESKAVRRVVLIAGGVGVNPLMSILAHLADENASGTSASEHEREVHMLYSAGDPGPAGAPREPDRILFLERIVAVFERGRVRGDLKLFLTPRAAETDEEESGGVVYCNEVELPFSRRRISADDLKEAVVGPDQASTVVYVCGPPPMTDDLVRLLTAPDIGGMHPQRVLSEKWW